MHRMRTGYYYVTWSIMCENLHDCIVGALHWLIFFNEYYDTLKRFYPLTFPLPTLLVGRPSLEPASLIT